MKILVTHDSYEDETMKDCERFGEAFVAPDESSEAYGPGDASFYHPSSGQQHKASPCLCVLDHIQLDVMLIGSRRCGFSSLSLVHQDKLHFLFRDPLHLDG